MQQNKSTIHVAVGIIRNTNDEVLIAKRPAHWLGAGFWEFPGGKVEPNEKVVDTLKRELHEEIGIRVLNCEFLLETSYEYPERKVVLHAWTVKEYSGTPEGLEGQELCWLNPEDFHLVEMLPANQPIVSAIQLALTK